MPQLSHTTLAILAALLSVFAFIPYAHGIYRGIVKPHFFTWLIWVIVTALVFVAQLVSGGGPGAWTTGVIALLCVVALVASVYRGEKSRTRFDWICLAAALTAIPLWLISGGPTFSVVLLTFIELVGFGPTIRKTWRDPYGENVFYYFLSGLKYLLGALALDVWTLDTVLYPVATCVMAFSFCALALGRRYCLARIT
jgi:hypothetical protein